MRSAARSIPLLALALAACRRDAPPSERQRAPDPPAAARPPPRTGSATPPPASAELVPVPQDVADRLALVQVAHGLARPVAFVVAPGDARKRWFIVEQHVGRIRVIENGVLSDRPFLKIAGVSTGNEQGLLGLAFHPKFAENGKLYVDYTDAKGDTHIDEYRVTNDPDRIDPATRREIFFVKQPFSNHNGGNLVFGPDGKLYTGMGDGGDAGDPFKNGQNKDALLAKILRFDVDAAGAKPAPERVHLGVRNPWRFEFDAATGDLYIGDVGQNLWENVYAVAGADHTQHNFGWNVVEGNHCFGADTCDRTGFTPPIADYPHAVGCSITGGFVYRGKALPELAGKYFYADYCTGILRSLVWKDGAVRERWEWKERLDRDGIVSQVSSFGVDADGELYLVELTGAIYRLARRP